MSLDVVSVVLSHDLLIAGSLRVLEAQFELLEVLLRSLSLPLFFFYTLSDLKFPIKNEIDSKGCVPLAKYDFPPSGALLFQEKGELL